MKKLTKAQLAALETVKANECNTVRQQVSMDVLESAGLIRRRTDEEQKVADELARAKGQAFGGSRYTLVNG